VSPPIHLWEKPSGSDLILVAGRNRLEAHKRSEHWISARIIRGDRPEIVRAVKLCEIEESSQVEPSASQNVHRAIEGILWGAASRNEGRQSGRVRKGAHRDLSIPWIRPGRWSDELWQQPWAWVSPTWHLYRAHVRRGARTHRHGCGFPRRAPNAINDLQEQVERAEAAIAKAEAAARARKHTGVVLNEHTDEDGAVVFRHACKLGFEGIVSKRLTASYRSGPSLDWLKVKNPDGAGAGALCETS
jgi:hypothetical protein